MALVYLNALAPKNMHNDLSVLPNLFIAFGRGYVFGQRPVLLSLTSALYAYVEFTALYISVEALSSLHLVT